MADDQSAHPEPQIDEKLDDDEPVRLQPDLPPEVASPLAPFAGAKPPAPEWFDEALAKAPERTLRPGRRRQHRAARPGASSASPA